MFIFLISGSFCWNITGGAKCSRPRRISIIPIAFDPKPSEMHAVCNLDLEQKNV
jgi:hypothetical protein